MKGFVYILKSFTSNRYYIGSTNDPAKRLFNHNAGYTRSTKYGVPWVICFQQEFPDLATARRIEYKLKKLRRKDYLERVISDGVVKLAMHGV